VPIGSYIAPVFKFSKDAQRIFDEKTNKNKPEVVEKKPDTTVYSEAPKSKSAGQSQDTVREAENFSPV
jgi:hypothetical protein